MPKTRFLRFIKVLFGNRAGSEAEFLRAEIEFNRLERFAHFWVLVVKSFVRNRCLIRASALSFSTLLALIPMLAVAISVTSSLLKTKGEQPIEQFVQKAVNNIIPPPSADTNEPSEVSETNENHFTNTIVMGDETNLPAETNSMIQDKRVSSAQKKVAEGIHNFIQNTRSGTLGVIGMLALVFVAIRMLANIEQTFNDIWGVARGRNWLFSTAFIGGLVGGSLWHLNNAFGFIYASRAVTNGKIYGKLGLLPVFMAGLYFSWVILLFGAQVAYAFQNRKLFLQDKIVENVNQRGREFVALRL